jgi:hypothetical protein
MQASRQPARGARSHAHSSTPRPGRIGHGAFRGKVESDEGRMKGRVRRDGYMSSAQARRRRARVRLTGRRAGCWATLAPAGARAHLGSRRTEKTSKLRPAMSTADEDTASLLEVNVGVDGAASHPLGIMPASGMTWQRAGGPQLAYRMFEAPQPKGVMFWQHGVGAHCNEATDKVFGEACVAAGLTCFMQDLTGHGYSEGLMCCACDRPPLVSSTKLSVQRVFP